MLRKRKVAADRGVVVPLQDDRFVFPSRVSARQLADIRTSWQNAVKAAGLGDFHFHELRHSAASFLAMDGASLREIGEVLGHRCTQTTRRYAHIAESHTHKIGRGMADRLLEGQVDA